VLEAKLPVPLFPKLRVLEAEVILPLAAAWLCI